MTRWGNPCGHLRWAHRVIFRKMKNFTRHKRQGGLDFDRPYQDCHNPAWWHAGPTMGWRRASFSRVCSRIPTSGSWFMNHDNSQRNPAQLSISNFSATFDPAPPTSVRNSAFCLPFSRKKTNLYRLSRTAHQYSLEHSMHSVDTSAYLQLCRQGSYRRHRPEINTHASRGIRLPDKPVSRFSNNIQWISTPDQTFLDCRVPAL